MKAAPGGADNPFCESGINTVDLSLALALLRSPSTRAALKEFATAGAEAVPGPTAYQRTARVLNLFVKQNVMARLDRDIALIEDKAGIEGIWTDPERIDLLKEADELRYYLDPYIYDWRNFPEFPADDEFLGPDQYFAMGDNRYNSIDCRMWDEKPHERVLDQADPTSVRYMSYIEPFALEKRFIDGYAVIRVWPFSRFGLIR